MNIVTLEERADFIHVLSNPIRIKILELLKEEALTVNQIVMATNISQSSISQHLSSLRGCGLVTSRQEGKHVYYKITNERITSLFTFIDTVIIETRVDHKHC
nr:metalloregulator ArsR/SmtB family transcription factor [Staphylococcus sp. ACRSN]